MTDNASVLARLKAARAYLAREDVTLSQGGGYFGYVVEKGDFVDRNSVCAIGALIATTPGDREYFTTYEMPLDQEYTIDDAIDLLERQLRSDHNRTDLIGYNDTTDRVAVLALYDSAITKLEKEMTAWA